MRDAKPTVMCFSGLDPTGGAGIQADVETLFALGCHTTPIITCLTTQSTENALNVRAVDAFLMRDQALTVIADMPVHAFKIGLVSAADSIKAIHAVISEHPDIPVVVDPVFAAGGGFEFSATDLREVLRSLLVPMSTVLTPNLIELTRLMPSSDSADSAVTELLSTGCKHVLVTGTHDETEAVENRLYSADGEISNQTWPRLNGSYHGSGCTLAAAIAGYLSLGMEVKEAVRQAQDFTWQSLKHAFRPGSGQFIPDRACWNRRDR